MLRLLMNQLVRNFFQEFSQVRFLSEEKDIEYSELSKIVPDLPRGWFELSRCSSADRISFVRDHWLVSLPFHPITHAGFSKFFSLLDDVAIVLAAENEGEALGAELIYSLAGNITFFRGMPPADKTAVHQLYDELGVMLPSDYLAFLKIHNGFGQLSSLGLLPCEFLAEMKQRVTEMVLAMEKPLQLHRRPVDPTALIPFFEEEGLFSFQCFYADWYPGSEMGNIYLSGIDSIMSDTSDWKSGGDNLAFSTFSEWLCAYLQGMNLFI